MSNAVDLPANEYIPTLALMKKIDFLEGVPDETLKDVLFSLQKETFSKDRTILFQGEIANRLFIIQKGKVIISTKNKGSKLVLAELSAPHYFGEISLLRPMSATATVTSGEEGTELIILNHDALTQLSKKLPDIQKRIQGVIETRLESKKQAKEAEETQ